MPYKDLNKRREYQKEYMKGYYQKNKDIITKIKKEYRENNKEKIKEYQKEYDKKYYKDNKEIIRKYRDNNKEKISKRTKEYRENNKEKIREYGKDYNKKNIIIITRKNKEYRENNKKKIAEIDKEYYKNNKDKIAERMKGYRRDNKEKIIKRRKEYSQRPEVKERINSNNRQQRKIDKNYSIKENIRKAFWRALKRYSKTGKIKPLKEYGINMKAVIEHLKPFPKDIKKYHIDHIIPVSFFNHNDKKEIQWAWAPENLQWLTVEENLKKGNRYILVNETGVSK